MTINKQEHITCLFQVTFFTTLCHIICLLYYFGASHTHHHHSLNAIELSTILGICLQKDQQCPTDTITTA